MVNGTATHRIISYQRIVTGKLSIPRAHKYYVLKDTVRGLLDKGRIVLSVDCEEIKSPISDFVIGFFKFDTVYVGRKSVKVKNIRHRLRGVHRKFLSQPMVVSLPQGVS